MFPRAIYDSESEKTFFGWNSMAGDIEIAAYDHATDSVDTSTVLSASFEVDDHGAPGILVRNDGKIMAVYSKHNGTEIYWRISSSPGDISSFNTEQSKTVTEATYCTPIQLFDGTIYVWFRGSGDNLKYIKSTDEGSTFNDPVTVITPQTNSIYPAIYKRQSSNRVHIGITDKYYPQGKEPQDIAHCYFEGETLYETDGTTIGGSSSWPVDRTDLTMVYDSSASGNRPAWIWDIRVDSDGDPAIVFATFPGEWAGKDHRYHYARYNNGWAVNEITQGGGTINALRQEPLYSPGVTIDDRNLSAVYVSRGGLDSASIKRFVTDDGGETWQSRDIAPADVQNVRPFSPWYCQDEVPVMWLRGKYRDFTRFDTEIAFGEDQTTGVGVASAPSLVRAHVSSDASLSGGDTIPFTANDDYLSEWDNTNNEFVPSESGMYQITVRAIITGLADGDEVGIEIEGSDFSSNLRLDQGASYSGSPVTIQGSLTRQLTAGSVVRLVMFGSGTVLGGTKYNELTIRQV
jgi:hypothetical protein